MLSLPIAFANRLMVLIERNWNSELWRSEVDSNLNPKHDPFIEEIQHFRFLILRQIRVRDAEYRQLYWRHMSREDQLIAEAEAQFYEGVHKDLFGIEMSYNFETYLQDELDAVNQLLSNKAELIKFIKLAREYGLVLQEATRLEAQNEIIDDRIKMRAMLDSGIELNLIPPNMVKDGRPEQLMHPEDAKPRKSIIPVPVKHPSFYRHWRDKLMPIQNSVDISWSLLTKEIADAGIESNKVTGVTAENHILLTDADIPIPTVETFHAWWNMCGINFRELGRLDREKLGTLFPSATHIMTYTIPAMPMTEEHKHLMIQHEDANANHSLTSKSKAHARDELGRIKHGLWLARTILLDVTNQLTLETAEDFISSAAITGRTLHSTHLDILPIRLDKSRDVFFGDESLVLAHPVKLPLCDPWLHTPFMFPHTYQMTQFQIWWDTAYRSMSKFYGVHFRFDTDIAALRWFTAFEAAALAWVGLTSNQRSVMYMQATRKLLQLAAPPKPKRQNRKWDLSNF